MASIEATEMGTSSRSLMVLLLACFLLLSCGRPVEQRSAASSHVRKNGHDFADFCIGEALVGQGNEVAHIDVMIGKKSGPVGSAFANALTNQQPGHSNTLAVFGPNLMVKPATVMITKVTVKGSLQAVQLAGPVQYAVSKAVTESVSEG